MKNFYYNCLILASVALGATSCSRDQTFSESVDVFLFQLYGGTIFEQPPKVGLKEIHLDDGRLQGKRLVVEGKVKQVGEYDSYVIIEDQSARMLVLLNKIIDTDSTLRKIRANDNAYGLRVLGTVYKGKKGLPYISADSLNAKPIRKKG